MKTIRDLATIPLLCSSIGRRNRIRPEDVAILRQICPRGLRLTLGEASAVFALARGSAPACAAWSDFLADAMGHWFVEIYARETAADEAANQLVAWLGGAEARLDPARFRMLAAVLETIPDCPEELLVFARACLVRTMAHRQNARATDAGAA